MDRERFGGIISEMESKGWCVVKGFLDEVVARELARECKERWVGGEFRRAGVGRGGDVAVREDVRRDHVMWLGGEDVTPSEQVYMRCLEELRMELNRRFYLGLFDFEGHFAVYPEGGFYKAHLDRHRGSEERIVTVILYLNEGWESGDGGELKLWTMAGEKDGEYVVVEPRLGTMVCFLSGDYWHEVLPAGKTRVSITGWFRRAM